jgi:putative transposase
VTLKEVIMNGSTAKQKRHSERKAKQKEKAERKAKVSKQHVLAHRRQADRARRARQRREKREHTEQRQREFAFRVKVVRYFHQLREQGVPEQDAVHYTYEQYRPREAGHFRLSFSTIRHWVRLVKQAGEHYHVLRPQSRWPKQIKYQVSARVMGLIFTLRHQKGWGGHRIAAELKKRGLVDSLTGRTVYKIIDRLGLPIKVYALKGKSDGIAYRRYEKSYPNAQWHIDLKQTTLADGTPVYICVIIDDHSRYVLAAVAGPDKTAMWTAEVTRQTIDQSGRPDEIVTDNGREFSSPWQSEDSLTQFEQMLRELGIEHTNSAPYYPQGNGKVEAFNRTLKRELLDGQRFETLTELQAALNRYLIYYNNYRAHSGLGWQTPVTRFTGRVVVVRGLAGLLGLEPMAADPHWGESYCDAPIQITPTTAHDRFALACPATATL